MAEPMYTCPMHPEIREAEAGRCPSCGMALVPEEGPAGPESRGSEPPYTKSREFVAPKFGSAGSGGAEYEPGPRKPSGPEGGKGSQR